MKTLLISILVPFIQEMNGPQTAHLNPNVQNLSLEAAGVVRGRLRQNNGEYTCRRRKDEVCGFVKTGSKLFIFPSEFAGPYPPGSYVDENNNVVAPFNSIITFGEGEEETTVINF